MLYRVNNNTIINTIINNKQTQQVNQQLTNTIKINKTTNQHQTQTQPK